MHGLVHPNGRQARFVAPRARNGISAGQRVVGDDNRAPG